MPVKFVIKRMPDVAVVLGMAVMLLIMLAPVYPWTMDLLVGVNISLSVLLFCLSVFVSQPVHLSIFPTLLLLATLYRLALNISSTRLILTQANPGRIIGGFGDVMSGGDVLVGAIIFVMLLLVLFMVITRGAQRVAEVAARFTLDALPGMQSAIESDMRLKNVSPQEIARRRNLLEHRSMFYGSLDGAMKFVRGDAVAALVITVINLVGGVAIGMIRRGLSFSDALNLYGSLTIGDGLASMLPALLISTTAAILVTRVGESNEHVRLGTRLGKQLFAEPAALASAATVVMLVAFVPGLPAWPFGAGAFVLASASWSIWRKRRRFNAAELCPQVPGRRMDLDSVAQALDTLSAQRPVLVREALVGKVTIPYLSDLLWEFEQDGLDVSYLPQILEALARETVVDDIDDTYRRLRMRMQDEISASIRIGATDQVLRAATLDSDSDAILARYTTITSRGKELVLPEGVNDAFVSELKRVQRSDTVSVVLLSPQHRRVVARLLGSRTSLKFLAVQELRPDVSVEIETQLAF